MSRVGSVFAMVVFLGCAPPVSGVRLKVAYTLRCSSNDVNVQWVRDLDYDAVGCGRKVALRCPPSDTGANCRAISAVTLVPQPTVVTSSARSSAGYGRVPAPMVPPSSPPGGIYMPGQYNQRTGRIQTDYSHQYTRP